MSEHVHACLTCTPGLVPDFNRADLRYHDPQKCRRADGIGNLVHRVFVDGAEIAYTAGTFAGPEGWALFAGSTTDAVHVCPCNANDVSAELLPIRHQNICVEPRFGVVTVDHLEAHD